MIETPVVVPEPQASQLPEGTEPRCWEVRVSPQLVEQFFRGGEVASGKVRIEDGIPEGALLVSAHLGAGIVRGGHMQPPYLVLRFSKDGSVPIDPDFYREVTPTVHVDALKDGKAAFCDGASWWQFWKTGAVVSPKEMEVIEAEAEKMQKQGRL